MKLGRGITGFPKVTKMTGLCQQCPNMSTLQMFGSQVQQIGNFYPQISKAKTGCGIMSLAEVRNFPTVTKKDLI